MKKISLAIFVLLMGCTPAASSPAGDPGSPIQDDTTPLPPISTSTTYPIKTANESNDSSSAVDPSETNFPSETPNPTVEIASQINFQCPKLVSRLHEEVFIKGNFILEPASNGENPYLLDPESGIRTELPYAEEFNLEDFNLSPNHEWIAYFASKKGDITTEKILVVSDSDSENIYTQSVSLSESPVVIVSWINNDILMLEHLKYDAELMILDTPLPVSTFNPFTRESEVMDTNFPNIALLFDGDWIASWKSGVVYNPSISLVSYARWNTEDNLKQIVLWDLRTDREIAMIRAAQGFGAGPVWAPDGLKFISDSSATVVENEQLEVIPDELFIVTRDGEITRLTNISDQYDKVRINGYVWAPDSNQVAFWLSTVPSVYSTESDSSGYHLTIVDIQTHRVTGLCIPGAVYSRPIWSLDGQQLLVGVLNETKSTGSGFPVLDTFLIDLQRNEMIKIEDEASPLGWLVP